MEKLLTLAVPSFNMSNYLNKCINSCICENMDSLDIIIVNDGSTDNTLEIANELQNKYPDVIRVIDKQNGHYGSCVNSALCIAKGKYFRMLDPDDWCDTKALNQLLDNLKTSDADLVITMAEDRLNGKDLLCRMEIPEHIEEGKYYDATTFSATTNKFKWIFCSHVLTYKTQILRDINLHLQTGICYTDNEYVFYPLDQIKTILFYRLPLYQYYVGREGASTSEKSIVRAQKEMWAVLKKMFNYYYANIDETCAAVKDNQRAMLKEMAIWILNPILLSYGSYGSESDKIIYELFQQICKDNDLLNNLSHAYQNCAIPLYKTYLNTGSIHRPGLYVSTLLALYKLRAIIRSIKG